ncbi:MAG: hypothetical protein ACO3JG_00410 [Luteolibacter sp.]
MATIPSAAGPLLYEGFDYPVSKEATHSSLAGANGGTGWGGGWKETKWPMADAVEPGLAFGRLGVKGNAATSTASSWGHATRATGDTLSKAGLLSNAATLWFSIVIDNSAASSGVKNGLALGTGAFSGDAQEKMPQGSFGVGLMQSGYDKVMAACWADGSLSTGNTGIYPTQATLFVGKIEWGATDDANETLTIYAPGTDLKLGNPVAKLIIPAVNQSEFDTVALLTKDNGRMDEIRFGAGSNDVIPGARKKTGK